MEQYGKHMYVSLTDYEESQPLVSFVNSLWDRCLTFNSCLLSYLLCQLIPYAAHRQGRKSEVYIVGQPFIAVNETISAS